MHIIEFVNNSDIEEKYKKIFTSVINDNKDEYTDFNIGEEYIVLSEIKTIIKEIGESIDKNICYGFFYLLIANKLAHKPEIYKNLLARTVYSNIFCLYIATLPKSKNSYLSFLQTVVPEIRKMEELLINKKFFLALKTYKTIIDICNCAGIDANLSNDELKNELNGRFPAMSLICNPNAFRKYLSNLELVGNEEKIDVFVYAKNYYYPAIALQRMLFELMQKYYDEEHIFYRQYDEEHAIFVFKDVAVVTYKHDDTPNMALINNNLTITWQDRDFWAKIFDKDIDFVSDSEINYFIDGINKKEYYKVVSLTYKNKPFYFLGRNVIFVPEDHLDEALAYNLCDKDNLIDNQLINLGLDTKTFDGKLLTGDDKFFFKDPASIDSLNLLNPQNYRYYNMIKDKQDSKTRLHAICQIQYHAQKNPKKPNIPQKKQATYVKKGPIPRKDIYD